MRIYAFVGVFFILVSCKGPVKKVIKSYKNGTPGLVYEYQDRNDTNNYHVKMYYPDGKIHKEAIVRDRKYIGEKITYFHNGNIYQIDSLLYPCEKGQDACDGVLIRYNENGTISQRFIVKDGGFNGLSLHFDGNGRLVKRYILKSDSLKDGQYTEFYNNGKPSLLATYKNDTLVGYEYFFKENGDTIKYYNHYKGQLDFPYKWWLENGTILYGNYLGQNHELVSWKWFDKAGHEIKEETRHVSKIGFVVPH